jgi:hypothetical protein
MFETREEMSILPRDTSPNLTLPRDDINHNDTSAVITTSLIDKAARSYNIGRR